MIAAHERDGRPQRRKTVAKPGFESGCLNGTAPYRHGRFEAVVCFYLNVSMRVGLSTSISRMSSSATPRARIHGVTRVSMWSHPWPP